ncbi:DNA topoisomerase IB [Robertkochia aurantiaca]|uniref:DNA topoisomerase IB n=1 Tax=Robertkochia aurantiaca TaxID=2873700 RepID=UPI001CCDFBD3|nr:DNA topoisomerase IB [Robertkochia sp. 3YJGBD-33]
MATTEEEIQKILNHPEQIISKYNLVYLDEDKLLIKRKKYGRGFTYINQGRRIKNKSERQRIKDLAIPPMWQKVRISPIANGHLQAVGFDAETRKQYLYHPQWTILRNATKFYKMYPFGKKLPLIREQVDKDLNKKGWPEEKVVALVIRLMEETHIRIGNTQYEKKNESYGLTTLRKRHIDIFQNSVKIEFTGKSGKKFHINIEDERLIELINQCEEIPGWTLFKFYDEEGTKRSLKSNHVNDYLQSLCGSLFTAKDFRTWSASVTFCNYLLDLDPTDDPDRKKKNLLQAYDAAAEALGNTRAVCRQYYVHPKIIDVYLNDTFYEHFDHNDKADDKAYLSPTEEKLIELYKDYEPKLDE